MTQNAELRERLDKATKELWEYFYRRRIGVLRGSKGDDWQDGVHIPSAIWGKVLALCDIDDTLWSQEVSVWQIRAEAHEAAYAKFVEEVKDGRAESKAHGSRH